MALQRFSIDDPSSTRIPHDQTFTVSSRCGSSTCVGAVAIQRDQGTVVVVADVQNGRQIPGTPALTFSQEDWTVFVAGVKNGDFDLQ